MNAKFAAIGEDGWKSISEPPDTDRKIQFAWSDMSYGDNSYGFYNVEAVKQGKNDIWWGLRLNNLMYMITPEYIGAWREIHNKLII
jgi:hypothetical protein